jgi:hypothetical protein
MRNGHDLVLQQTQGEESALTIGLADIFSSESKPAEDLLSIAKAMPCFFRLARRFASAQANMPECSYRAWLRQGPTTTTPRSNGEVEGPPRSASSATRAHNFF